MYESIVIVKITIGVENIEKRTFSKENTVNKFFNDNWIISKQRFLKIALKKLFWKGIVRNFSSSFHQKHRKKKMSKSWLHKTGKRVYEHLVLRFNIPWRNKFHLLKLGKTLVKYFPHLIQKAFWTNFSQRFWWNVYWNI